MSIIIIICEVETMKEPLVITMAREYASGGSEIAQKVADLLGIPLRVIVSPRSLREGCCEISARDGSFSYRIPLDQTAQRLWQLVKEMLAFQEEKSAIER